jgi:hypothetical protein
VTPSLAKIRRRWVDTVHELISRNAGDLLVGVAARHHAGDLPLARAQRRLAAAARDPHALATTMRSVVDTKSSSVSPCGRRRAG